MDSDYSTYLCTRFKTLIVTFEDLNLTKPYLNALADLEYEYPTPIQEKAFPIVMSGKNVIGIAQTGTGKTFAYLLPLLRQLPFSDQKEPRILILAPTHELVLQILNEINKLTKYTSLRAVSIHGGGNINTQKQVVYNGMDILVGTPGRLIDLAYTGVLRLKSIQKLVIDEVDEMLSLGFRTQLTNILELLPEKRQNLMFSATLDSEVETFIENTLPFYQKIEIAAHGTPLNKITQRAYNIPNFFTKINYLEMLLQDREEFNKVLIFVGTKKLADRLFEQIDKKFPNEIGVIHSNKAHNTRLNAVKNFQDGTHRILIATDVIARGMDILDVTHVINFDIPEAPGDYIHRIGRTGRADKAGVAISFINDVEQDYLYEIEKMMKMIIPHFKLPEDLVFSPIFSEEEKPAKLVQKNYLKAPKFRNSQGAFHEKSEKNKKVNRGGPKKRNALYDKSGKLKTRTKPDKTRF